MLDSTLLQAVRTRGLTRCCMPVHVTGRAIYGLVFALLQLFFVSLAYAETKFDELPADAEEIGVEIVHREIGITVIPSILVGDKIYLRIPDIFKFAGIRLEQEDEEISFKGFFIKEDATYSLDADTRTLEYAEQEHVLSPSEALVLKNGVYIRSDVIESTFGLSLAFDFSALTVQFNCDCELPVIELRKREKARKNKRAMQAPETAEYSYPLSRRLLSVGALDWSFSSNLQAKRRTDAFSAKAGIQFLGGDAEAFLLGEPDKPILAKDIDYQWRYGIAGSSLLTEIDLGNKLANGLQLADSMIGFQINNRPRETKSSFASYEIFDHTEPGWMVELYINQALVDFTQADDAGNYSFVIPISYGTTQITRKFYGVYGEVRIEESSIEVPYTFLSPGSVEYNLSGGTPLTRFAPESTIGAADVKLGISSRITLGGGLQYDPHNTESPYMPTGSLSISPFSGLLLSGDYYHESGVQATFNADAIWGVSIGGGITHLFPDAKKRLGRNLEEQRQLQLQANMPWIQGNLRMQATERPTSDATGEIVLASTLTFNTLGIPFSFGGDSRFSRDHFSAHHLSSTVRGSISLSTGGVYFRPELYYDVFTRSLTTANLRIQKSFGGDVFVSASGVRDFRTGNITASAELRLNLGILQISSGSTSSSVGTPTYNGSAQGSIMFDPVAMDIAFSDRSAVSTGGVLVRPFIDENVNEEYDEGEKIVPSFAIQGAGKPASLGSGLVRVTELQPYQPYILKPDLEGMQNIAIVPKYKSFGITPPANGFAMIDFPMYIAGQINGYVNFKKESGPEPAAGVRMLVMRLSDSTLMEFDEDFLTYESGEFFNVGLLPGKYAVAPDAAQLAKLKLEAEPKYREFTLRSIEEGDMVENLNFDIIPMSGSSKPMAFGRSTDKSEPVPAEKSAKPEVKASSSSSNDPTLDP